MVLYKYLLVESSCSPRSRPRDLSHLAAQSGLLYYNETRAGDYPKDISLYLPHVNYGLLGRDNVCQRPLPAREGRRHHDAPPRRPRPAHAHTDLGRIYYEQRAAVPGTLLIAEATYVSRNAGHYSAHEPGVYSEEQIEGWRKV